MDTLAVAVILLVVLLVTLASGLWIAMAMSVVAWVGLQFFTTSPPDVNLFHRITSYNVCYTKLLRERPSPIRFASAANCSRTTSRTWPEPAGRSRNNFV